MSDYNDLNVKVGVLSKAAENKWRDLDIDGSGILEGNEVPELAAWVWGSFNPGRVITPAQKMQEASKMLEQLDHNGDGKIAFDEFHAYYEATTAAIMRSKGVHDGSHDDVQVKPTSREAWKEEMLQAYKRVDPDDTEVTPRFDLQRMIDTFVGIIPAAQELADAVKAMDAVIVEYEEYEQLVDEWVAAEPSTAEPSKVEEFQDAELGDEEVASALGKARWQESGKAVGMAIALAKPDVRHPQHDKIKQIYALLNDLVEEAETSSRAGLRFVDAMEMELPSPAEIQADVISHVLQSNGGHALPFPEFDSTTLAMVVAARQFIAATGVCN